MTYPDAMQIWVMPLVAVTELKRNGVPAWFDSVESCVWVEDISVRHGVTHSNWVRWPLSGHGRIHGSRVLRFLGY